MSSLQWHIKDIETSALSSNNDKISLTKTFKEILEWLRYPHKFRVSCSSFVTKLLSFMMIPFMVKTIAWLVFVTYVDSLHIFILKMIRSPSSIGDDARKRKTFRPNPSSSTIWAFQAHAVHSQLSKPRSDRRRERIYPHARRLWRQSSSYMVGVLSLEWGHTCVTKAHKVVFHILTTAGNAAKVSFVRLGHGSPQGITGRGISLFLWRSVA